jgi:hypothetical protein
MNTGDYILVLQDIYCDICYKLFTDKYKKWCKPCQLKKNFTNWTSGNEKIDNLIQKMQLRINNYDNIIVEWIPYDQFNDIIEIGKGGIAKISSAIWKGGPLQYDMNQHEYLRNKDVEVILRCFHNSQNIINEFLNEV